MTSIITRLLLLLLCGTMMVECEEEKNPECQDLEKVQKKFLSTVNALENSKLQCKPNRNCTGLNCFGTFKGKKVNGSVIISGCHGPLSLTVHYGQHKVVVHDGSKTKLWSKLYAVTSLKKHGNTAIVSVKMETCLKDGKDCIPFGIPLLTKQKIRLNCDGVTEPPTMPIIPAHPSLPRPYYDSPPKNPECQGLQRAKTMIENQFDGALSLFYQARIGHAKDITCEPSQDCSELNCSGFAMNAKSNDSFTASLHINYCTSPVSMTVRVDVPNKDIHIEHKFEDGGTRKVYVLPMTVHLKRQDNIIYVTIEVLKISLVKNLAIEVDPTRCPGYIAPPPAGGEVNCDRLNKLGKHVMNRKEDVLCHSDKQCSKLICKGKYGADNFISETSIDHCSFPITLNMTITARNNTRTHTFEDDETYNMSLPIKVQLKRWYNDILVNISINGDFFALNHIFNVDEKECGEWDGNKCDSLNNLGRHIENRKENIQCNSDPACKKLKCIGKYGKTPFNSATKIYHCSSPISLLMVVFADGKKYKHYFKDGEVYNMPLPTKVDLKRIKNDILVNISINGDYFVLNHVFKVNPKECGKKDKSSGLSDGAIAGIVIAVLVLFIIIITTIIVIIKKKNLSVRIARYNDLAMGDDSAPLYGDGDLA